MLDKFIRDELNKFAKYVIQQARTRLTRSDKNVSSELYNSLNFNIEENNNKTSLSFEMEDYGKFQDKGVSGTEKKYNTPYSYTNKMPPTKAFDKWVIRRGIAPRGKGGAFAKRQSLKFLIARSIYKKGIRPSLFFTKPFEAAFKRLPDDLVKAYSIGIEKMIQVNIKEQ
jgi:hypothetical protein